jgi:hypothetical protein
MGDIEDAIQEVFQAPHIQVSDITLLSELIPCVSFFSLVYFSSRQGQIVTLADRPTLHCQLSLLTGNEELPKIWKNHIGCHGS